VSQPPGPPPPAPPPRTLAGNIVINVPGSTALVKTPVAHVPPPGSICANGTGSPPSSGAVLTDIWAYIYAPGDTVPDTPPAGAVQGVVTGDTTWQFVDPKLIPNVLNAATAPYPQNLLAVWGHWSTDAWNYGTQQFGGITAKVTDCD